MASRSTLAILDVKQTDPLVAFPRAVYTVWYAECTETCDVSWFDSLLVPVHKTGLISKEGPQDE